MATASKTVQKIVCHYENNTSHILLH